MAKKKRPAATDAESPLIKITPRERAILEAHATPRVRDILTAIAELPSKENWHLCSWLYDYLHPEWIIVQTSDVAQLERALEHATKLQLALEHATKEARYHAGKVRAEENPERNAKIIELWAGGPKVPGGRAASQIRLWIKNKYPQWMTNKDGEPLTKGAIQRVITDHVKRQKRRRAAGL